MVDLQAEALIPGVQFTPAGQQISAELAPPGSGGVRLVKDSLESIDCLQHKVMLMQKRLSILGQTFSVKNASSETLKFSKKTGYVCQGPFDTADDNINLLEPGGGV